MLCTHALIFVQWNISFSHPLKHTVFQENLIFELIDLIEDFFRWIENKVCNIIMLYTPYYCTQCAASIRSEQSGLLFFV